MTRLRKAVEEECCQRLQYQDFEGRCCGGIICEEPYFFDHSQFASEVGVKITATFDVLKDISLTAEFKDGKLSKLVPSEGLQKAVRERLKIENVKPDESVLRWLR